MPMLSVLLFALVPQQIVLAADRVHLGDGAVLENAAVTIADGKIVAVAPGAAPSGAWRVPGAELTPGLIDPYSYMGVDGFTLEQGRENTAGSRLADSVRLDAPAFRRALEEGVTTAYLSPDSLNVFGGLGAIVKTAGGASADLFAPPDSGARLLADAAALKISIGNDPSDGNYPPRGAPPASLYGRRPNTRMGVVWAVRSEFYRALEYRRRGGQGDRDLDVLLAVIDGRLPVRVQARRSHDVQTALRLAAEFGWKHLIVEEGTEAYRAAPLLAQAQVPVICGPLYDELTKAVAQGVTAEQWRAFTSPPAICCEHDEALPEHYREVDERGIFELHGLALDLVSVVLPRYEAAGVSAARASEGDLATPALPALLRRAGVRCALGAAEAHDGILSEASVIHQARLAVRYGLPPEQALALAAAEAAALLGVGDRVGSLAPGYDADLVLWSGPPLDAATRPLLVIVDGRVVLDRRPQSPAQG